MAPRGTFRTIADLLRGQIRSGSLEAGSLIPSELALAAEHGVARGTVRAALDLLVEEGLLEVMPGKGRRVAGGARPTPTAAYERIAAELADRIGAGEYGLAGALPSEAELMTGYGVSRNTVRRAYQRLVEQGLVVIRQGAGAFVAPR